MSFLSALNKNINHIPYKKLHELENGKHYKILKLNKIKTKFGDCVVAQFKDFKTFLPTRINSDVLPILDQIQEELKTAEVYLIKNMTNNQPNYSFVMSVSNEEEEEEEERECVVKRKRIINNSVNKKLKKF